MWKFYDREQYIKDKAKEEEMKENARLKKEAEAKEREFRLSTTAKEYYATMTNKYSKFDEEGVPTHNAKGEELSKEQLNKLKKEFAKHNKQHQKWLEQKQGDGSKAKDNKKKKDKKIEVEETEK